MSDTGLAPRWASAPGATIKRALDQKGLALDDFAERCGIDHANAEALLVGEAPITLALARELAGVVGGSPTFWLTREAQFLEDRARVEADHWSQEMPIAQMVRFGWIAEPQSWQERISECLGFFGVETVTQWEDRYRQQLQLTRYRTSPTYDLDAGATTAWLRAAERIVSARDSLGPYRAEAFADMVRSLRHLTRERDPLKFVPELERACSDCGVALVVVRAPVGCPVSGATRRYSANPLIQLSARYLTDDHFWFTFFHEAGHVLLHGIDDVFVDVFGEEDGEGQEQEANDFASQLLLNAYATSDAPELTGRRWSHREALREALELGISPGVLVGQLQHREIVPRSHLNGLKRRFAWREDGQLVKAES